MLGLVALARQTSPPAWLGPAVWALLILVITSTAWRLARALCGEAPPAIHALAASLLGLVLASLVASWLGLAGALSLGTALLLTGAAAAAVLRYVSPVLAGGAGPTARATSSSLAAVDLARDPVAAAAVALGATAIGVALLNQVRYVTTSVDGLWYHLPMVAEWMQSGSIWAVGGLSTIHQGYPGFRESILLFLSLPLHQEHLALLGLVEFPLFALAVFTLATTSGAPPRLGALLAAYAVSAPVVARASTSQTNDLLLAIAFVLAVIFSARLVERPTRGHGALTGVALGALAATKFTGIGYAFAVVAVGGGRRLLRLRRTGRGTSPPAGGGDVGGETLEADEARRNGTPVARAGQRAPSLGRGARGLLARGAASDVGARFVREMAPWLWAAGAALLVAAPWYARNLVTFENPLYPAGVTLGPLGKAFGWSLRPLVDASGLFVPAYGPLVPLAGLGALVLAVAALARRPVGRRHTWLLALAVAGVAIFLLQPLDMASQWDQDTFHDFTPAFVVLSVAALSAASAAPRVVAAATAVLLIAGTLINIGAWAPGRWVAVAAALAAGTAGWVAARSIFRFSLPRLRLRRLRRPSMAGGVLGALVALAIAAAGLNALRARWQYDAVYGYPAALADRGGAGEVWAHVHRTLSRERVVAYGLEPTFPLYGDELSNRVVAVREPLDPEALLKRCDAEHADYLVVFIPVPGTDPRWSPTMAGRLLVEHADRVSLAFSSDRAFLLRIVPRP